MCIHIYIYPQVLEGKIRDGSRGDDLVLTELFFESDYPQSPLPWAAAIRCLAGYLNYSWLLLRRTSCIIADYAPGFCRALSADVCTAPMYIPKK